MSLVGIAREDDVCVLTLQREEKLNALSGEVERDLGTALDDDAVRSSKCVVLTGAGRAFSAGADISEFRDRSPESVITYYRETGNVYERVAALPQPTISAIHGYCLGGGLELALATDYRLVRLVGPGRAKQLMLLGGRLDANGALAAGLVNEVAADAQARALELARGLAKLPALAVSLTKQAIDLMPEASREAGILIERLAYGMLAQSEDAQKLADEWGKR